MSTNDSSGQADALPDVDVPPALSNRYVEKFEVLLHRLNPLVYKYQDESLHDIYHQLWMMWRVLRNDPDLSRDDIAPLLR